MSGLRAVAGARPIAATAAAAVAGVLVAGATLACLLDSDLGGYVVAATAVVAAATAAGAALFLAMPGAAPARTPVGGLALRAVPVAFAAALAVVAFDVMHVSGDGLRGLADPLSRSVALTGPDYQAALTRCAGLVVIAWALQDRAAPRPAVAAVGALVVCGSFALTGHARTHTPAALVVVCVVAHVVAVTWWWGGLLGVGTALRQARPDRAAVGRLVATFAHLMTGVLVMLLSAGVALALLYLHPVTALWSTAYGRVLLVKTTLVAAVLAVGAVNHRRLAPRAARGDRPAMQALAATVAGEQIVLVAVLVITAVLVGQNPNG